MKVNLIQNFSITNFKPRQNYHSVPFLSTQKNISFKSEPDFFERNIDYSEVEKTLAILDDKLAKLLKEGEELRTKEFSSIREKMFATKNYNTKLEQIRTEYKKIRALFDVCKENNIAKNAKIMTKFLQQMESLGNNKGFDRIVGYENIKNELKNKFILDIVLKDKISDKVDVPNAILFYGPTGNGKTTFAKALAEQALMNVYTVNAANMSEVDAMNLIEHYAKESKKTFEASNDKKRSIILFDEADMLLYENSPVIDRFKNFIQNCSKDYKCTLFLTTNHPLVIDKKILSKEITPFKIPVIPPDETTIKAILDKKLKQAGCNKYVDTQYIAEKMSTNPTRRYSNGDISGIIEHLLLQTPNPTSGEFLSFLNDDAHKPTIIAKKLSKFREEMLELNK